MYHQQQQCMRLGSPPQAWGRLRLIAKVAQTIRFTPTGVGTASISSSHLSLCSVHPHRRGDGYPQSNGNDAHYGSPPQAWGRPRRACQGANFVRFTPTGVGTAHPNLYPARLNAVHPHRRGDGGNWDGAPHWIVGSPPQAWGRPVRLPSLFSSARFTPTGVGTAVVAASAARSGSVHPHRRGDGMSRQTRYELTVGSPPQAWGRHPCRARGAAPPRFTPTGVGTAPAVEPLAVASPVHPHRRGDGLVSSI